MEKSDFQTTPYSYERLLEEIYERKSAELEIKEPLKLRLREPVLEKVPKHTVWANWSQTLDSLGSDSSSSVSISYSEHLKEWLCKELSTEANVNGQGQLVMRGIWKLQGICSLLRKYVQYYKKCKQCKQVDTRLIYQGKIVKVWCDRCKTDTYVDT
jgi:translation initiation factor 2 beta subunit (eIF-2beta)/eIF-5